MAHFKKNSIASRAQNVSKSSLPLKDHSHNVRLIHSAAACRYGVENLTISVRVSGTCTLLIHYARF